MDAVQEVVDFPFYNLKNPLKVYIKYHFNILSFISSRVSFNLTMNATINDNNISMLGFFSWGLSYLVLQVGWSLSQLSHGDMYVFVLWGWGAGVPGESPRRHRENMQALCKGGAQLASGLEPYIFLLWGSSANHCTTVPATNNIWYLTSRVNTNISHVFDLTVYCICQLALLDEKTGGA